VTASNFLDRHVPTFRAFRKPQTQDCVKCV